jgi:hypothetical protein
MMACAGNMFETTKRGISSWNYAKVWSRHVKAAACSESDPSQKQPKHGTPACKPAHAYCNMHVHQGAAVKVQLFWQL